MHACKHTHIHTHINTGMHACMQTYINTHTPDPIRSKKAQTKTVQGEERRVWGGKGGWGALAGTCTHVSDVSWSNTPSGSALIVLPSRRRYLSTRRAGISARSPGQETHDKKYMHLRLLRAHVFVHTQTPTYNQQYIENTYTYTFTYTFTYTYTYTYIC